MFPFLLLISFQTHTLQHPIHLGQDQPQKHQFDRFASTQKLEFSHQQEFEQEKMLQDLKSKQLEHQRKIRCQRLDCQDTVQQEEKSLRLWIRSQLDNNHHELELKFLAELMAEERLEQHLALA
jgi:hypothetical protein